MDAVCNLVAISTPTFNASGSCRSAHTRLQLCWRRGLRSASGGQRGAPPIDRLLRTDGGHVRATGLLHHRLAVTKRPRRRRKRSRLSQWTETTARSLTRFAEEYIMEWTLATDAGTRLALAKTGRRARRGHQLLRRCLLCQACGLCPFCNLASRVLVAAAANGDTFTLHIADLLNEDREALRLMLDVPVLTWPVIYIRGTHLTGGGEAIARLEKSNESLAAYSRRSAYSLSQRPSPLWCCHGRGCCIRRVVANGWAARHAFTATSSE